jgi:hypothetical protein
MALVTATIRVGRAIAQPLAGGGGQSLTVIRKELTAFRQERKRDVS